jgi:cyclopropane-fatty-acyl-phospholipid synthase
VHHGLVIAGPGSTGANDRLTAGRPSTAFDRLLVDRLQRSVAAAPLRFELWDGHAAGSEPERAVGTIVFGRRRALLSWVWDPELYLGETYMNGSVDIRGDLEAVLETIYRAWPDPVPRRRARPVNDLPSARANVHAHYDLGNDFYRLWLDRELLYTCAYYPTPEATLDEAQVAKMDRVCRKIGLHAGDRVIEAGCGWGALALHMARCYGARVRAFNVSSEQLAYARERARELGVSDRVEFVEADYRNIDGTCDVFVSIGMLEHVGLEHFETLGRIMVRTLGRDGRGLLHFIGRNRPAPLNPWIRKRIFPGAYPPTLGEVCGRIFEPWNLSVLDVENLRLHYAATLAAWRQRFRDVADEVRTRFDEAFVRGWDLYLAGSQAAFATGTMQLFQVVFAPGASNAVPWTRDRSEAGWIRHPHGPL